MSDSQNIDHFTFAMASTQLLRQKYFEKIYPVFKNKTPSQLVKFYLVTQFFENKILSQLVKFYLVTQYLAHLVT